jgi:hypothetical protein
MSPFFVSSRDGNSPDHLTKKSAVCMRAEQNSQLYRGENVCRFHALRHEVQVGRFSLMEPELMYRGETAQSSTDHPQSTLCMDVETGVMNDSCHARLVLNFGAHVPANGQRDC